MSLGMGRILMGDNVERALNALERIAKALEEQNELEQSRQKIEKSIRRGRALA